MEKAVFCWSGGKDSALAFYELSKSGHYEVVSLLTTITADYDRISMHGVRRCLLREQAKNLGLPVCEIPVSAACSNEEYENKMSKALGHFKSQGVLTVVFGDIFLGELRKYREGNLARIGMNGCFPIWHRDTAELSRTLVSSGFKAVVSCVDTRKLDMAFAGRIIDNRFLDELPPGVDPCGENGEYHSFVFDGPIFHRPISVKTGGKVMRDTYFYFCDLLPANGAAGSPGGESGECNLAATNKYS